MIIRDIEQGSDSWMQMRVGFITASEVWRLMPGAKGSYLKERDNYLAELACEILTNEPYQHFVTKEMERGKELEHLARSAFEGETGQMVEEVAIIEHDTIKMLKGSPDGILGNDGCIEIKMPNTANHFKTIQTGKIDRKYIFQMNVVMMCGNFKYCQFISYDDRAPENLQLYIKRIDKDKLICENIHIEILKFCKELENYVAKLKGYKAKTFNELEAAGY